MIGKCLVLIYVIFKSDLKKKKKKKEIQTKGLHERNKL